MTLHDWIDELCDLLDVDAEVDEALVLDLARDAAQNVQRAAAAITTYLLGNAAAAHEANPERLEALAAAASELAEKWSAQEEDDDSADFEDDGVADDEAYADVD